MKQNNRRRNNNNRRVAKRRGGLTNFAVPGNANRAPVASGTVQIPRPLTVRGGPVKAVFRSILQATTGTGQTQQYFTFSLYNCFRYGRTGSSNTFSVGAISNSSLLDFVAAYDVYKPKRIQLIIQSLSINTVVSYPWVACMDLNQDITQSPTEDEIIAHSNSTTLDSRFPIDFVYVIPPASQLSAGTGPVFGGGWIASDYLTTVNSPDGSVNLGMPVTVASTAYARIEIVYEIWFKNQS